MGSAYTSLDNQFLPQGALISFVLPYATTLELTGRLNGVILSRRQHDQVNHRPCICPIIYGQTPVNESLGIRFPTETDQHSYLRPDLSCIIERDHGQISLHRDKENSEPLIVSRELTMRAAQQFVEIIRPTDAKLSEKGCGFLAYGQMGKSDKIPRTTDSRYDSVPIVNLTPPEIYKQSGMAIIARAYSHIENFSLTDDVGVRTNKWFAEGYFRVEDFVILPTKGTLSGSSGWSPLTMDRSALKAFAKKGMALFDSEARDQVVKRYGAAPRGCWPGFAAGGKIRQHLQHSRR